MDSAAGRGESDLQVAESPVIAVHCHNYFLVVVRIDAMKIRG